MGTGCCICQMGSAYHRSTVTATYSACMYLAHNYNDSLSIRFICMPNIIPKKKNLLGIY